MIQVFIAGDSTAAIKLTEKRPESGWGEYLARHLDEEIIVRNFAQNGRSTKSFQEEGLLDQIMAEIKPGDYLFIQFGHNDQKMEDPSRYTDPKTTYPTNLKTYIQLARDHGAQPVLLTSVTRRAYLSNGQLDPNCLGTYPQVMRQVAGETKVPLLDLFQASQEAYRTLSQEETKALHLHLRPGQHPNYPEGVEDNTHYNDRGAAFIARLVAQQIHQSDLDLKKHLVEASLLQKH